jgi:hypothetical protein
LARNVWILNEKSENFVSDTHFYVFVVLAGVLERPGYHIVPSLAFAERTSTSHREWLRTPGHTGRQHVDNPVHQFSRVSGEMGFTWIMTDAQASA